MDNLENKTYLLFLIDTHIGCIQQQMHFISIVKCTEKTFTDLKQIIPIRITYFFTHVKCSIGGVVPQLNNHLSLFVEFLSYSRM
jgi:hypothetical protein